ncbi:MAG: ArnT family glycosyltransferase [Anaerolineae bacterium]
MPLRHPHKIILTLILLTAALMRIVGFVTHSPPGPEHDEVANWLIDKAIMAGQHGVYFTEAYGHEAGFHYWQTLFVWLVGDNLIALRAPAALMGLLSVAVTYALNRRLFGRDFAILATAIIAVLFMPVFYSRLALRAISLPVTAGLAACFMWDYFIKEERRYLIEAALLAGLSSYTYLASRTLPIFFVGFLIYIAIFHRQLIKSTWRDWLLFAAVYLLVSLPLILFLQNPQNIEIRTGEIDGPMRAMLSGDFQPVLQNTLAILGGFGFSGDPLWRQGVAFQPIFEPIFAILFYGGLLISLWRIRDIRYGFLLVWLGASVVPSVVTVDAPSTIRMILMLPVTVAFPIVVIEQVLSFFGFSFSRTKVIGNSGFVHSYPQLSTRNSQLSTTKMSFTLISVLTVVILLFYGVRSGRDVWITWPNSSEVQFVWQKSLTEIGRNIDQHPEITQVSIAGWTPESMDDPTLELTLKNDSVQRRHFGRVGEIQTLVVPSHEPNLYTIYRPADLPFHPSLNNILTEQHQVETEENFVIYSANAPIQFSFIEVDQIFSSGSGNRLIFSGYQFVESADPKLIELITVWQVDNYPNPTDPDTKLFLHLVDANGNLLAQHDGLDAPHRFWQTGDTLIQLHQLAKHDDAAEMRIGVYAGQEPWPRFIRSDGSDFLMIPID